jgi:hypothetical protein
MTGYTTKGLSVARVFIRSVLSPVTLGATLAYLGTVAQDFFFLQFAVKFGWKKIPIINVDHELDAAVPFTPSKVGIYLDFVALWIRPLQYIKNRCGRKASLKYTKELVMAIDRCYRDAARVYRFRMTTTKRPKYYKGPFKTIHIFDPHYMCVPSLHVIVVVLAYTFYRRVFAELGITGEEAEGLNNELYQGAVSITETVLYIKQHSVNCIPAALYVMTRISPDSVTPTEVDSFLKCLFSSATDISPENVSNIRAHIMDTYEQLFLEGCHDTDWVTPLQRWLVAYEEKIRYTDIRRMI